MVHSVRNGLSSDGSPVQPAAEAISGPAEIRLAVLSGGTADADLLI